MKKPILLFNVIVVLGLVLSACGPAPALEGVEVAREVEVEKPIEVEKPVEVGVTREVEVEKVVTATPVPVLTIQQVALDYSSYLGQAITVSGHYGRPGAAYLVTDYRYLARNGKMPEGTSILLAGGLPGPEWEGEWITVTGVVQHYDNEYPHNILLDEDRPILHLSDTQASLAPAAHARLKDNRGIGGLLSYPMAPRSAGRLSPYPNDSCLYVVVISGPPHKPATGGSYDNHDRYWNDTIFAYNTFSAKRPNGIYVLYSNGVNRPANSFPGQLAGTIPAASLYAATRANLTTVFTTLGNSVTDGCELDVVTTGHGVGVDPDDGISIVSIGGIDYDRHNDGRVDTAKGGHRKDESATYGEADAGKDFNNDGDKTDAFEFDRGIVLFNDILYDDEFEDLLASFTKRLNERNVKNVTVQVFMEQCFSNGFLLEASLAVDGRPYSVSNFVSATREDKPSWACDTEGTYDEFLYHFISALNGADPSGNKVSVDENNDGTISWSEAFHYAEDKDSRSEGSTFFGGSW